MSAFEDAVDEALYQEIDYLIEPEKEDLLDSPAMFHALTSIHELAVEPPGQHINATGNGYDDVEESPLPEISSFLGMSENHFFPEEGGGATYSQTDKDLHYLGLGFLLRYKHVVPGDQEICPSTRGLCPFFFSTLKPGFSLPFQASLCSLLKKLSTLAWNRKDPNWS
ncbi:hypothetical protein HPG69_004072 [Diceros bicornis minor]|uniref:Uncharacterized protein n=1 Tax=Diceros bicornis minor TaxID=77932 RepID=A0A7J7E9A8_DICBM|nr:hypothetical protein HPG69_004072 [Diceros bicornis minor]